MEFTERRYSVLLVSSSPKFNESMLALLPESRFYPVAAVSDVSSARRRLLESKYDIVIINAPLPDDFGTRLALNICDNSGTAVLLFVKAEHYPDINGRYPLLACWCCRSPPPRRRCPNRCSSFAAQGNACGAWNKKPPP